LMSMAKKFPEEKLVVDFHLQSFLGEWVLVPVNYCFMKMLSPYCQKVKSWFNQSNSLKNRLWLASLPAHSRVGLSGICILRNPKNSWFAQNV
jgi:hypothetical protein